MAEKMIHVDDLRLGMYLVGFEGSWSASPFWKSGFVLEKAADLRKARGSALRECWIDTSRGIDVETEDAGATEQGRRARSTHTVLFNRPAVKPAAPVSFETEMRNARRVCSAARESIVSMFAEARLGRAVDHAVCQALVGDIVDSVSVGSPGTELEFAL